MDSLCTLCCEEWGPGEEINSLTWVHHLLHVPFRLPIQEDQILGIQDHAISLQVTARSDLTIRYFIRCISKNRQWHDVLMNTSMHMHIRLVHDLTQKVGCCKYFNERFRQRSSWEEEAQDLSTTRHQVDLLFSFSAIAIPIISSVQSLIHNLESIQSEWDSGLLLFFYVKAKIQSTNKVNVNDRRGKQCNGFFNFHDNLITRVPRTTLKTCAWGSSNDVCHATANCDLPTSRIFSLRNHTSILWICTAKTFQSSCAQLKVQWPCLKHMSMQFPCSLSMGPTTTPRGQPTGASQ